MKLGMLTVMMADQPVKKVLDLMKGYKMEAAEFYSGAMFPNTHCNPDELHRSWNFRTVGWGHGPEYWTQFLINLRMIGYDYVLSIEHEDSLMSANEGLEKAVSYLNGILLRQKPGPMTWA